MKNSSTFLFNKSISLLILLTCFFSYSGNTQCRLLNENFNTSPVLSPANVDGAWYPDRYRPAAFTNDAGRLKISIDGIADGAAGRGAQSASFYNTQGRKFNQCGNCVTLMKGDLYIPADWATKHRRTDMWATAFDVTNTISAYPIIGFRNPDGVSPGIYYWDETINLPFGAWVYSGVTIAYNTWYNLEFRLAGANIEYLVNGSLVGTYFSGGSTYFGNIIMQAYNFNDPALPALNQSADSYDAYWDNLITTGTNGNVVTNINTGQTFCSIQSAIDASATVTGNTLQVGPGMYSENIIVNKSLTILGPNSGINPCSGVRVAEAIVLPASAGTNFLEIFHVAASNVTISGFTIDGDNPDITSGYSGTNGADIDAAEGITVYETGINNLTATNNIIKNLSYFGVTLYDYPAGVASSGHVISNNKIQDLGTYDPASGIDRWGGGVLLYNNQYAAVTNNCMTNVRLGVQTGNFYQANPGTAASQVISGNTIQARRVGVFHNLHYGTASSITIQNNNITGLANANETGVRGMLFGSLSVPAFATDNTINLSAVSVSSTGYEVWNVKNTTPVAISDGMVSGVNTGVFLNNFEGYNSNATDGAHATITGVNITPKIGGFGIRLLDSPGSTTNANVQATATNNFITGGAEGVKLEETISGKVTATVNNNSITGQSGFAINAMAIGNAAAATCNWYGTANSVAVASKILGPVTFIPYLVNGTDNAPASGFQPVPGTCMGGIPQLSTTINGVTVNSNNDGSDDFASFAVCNYPSNIQFNSFTDQNGLNVPLLRVYQTLTTSNITVPFCNNCWATMAAFTGASGTAALINPAMPGTLVMRFKAWVDLNTNSMIDPAELQGDWIQYTMTINPRPALQSTLNTITLTNNHDGNDETAALTVCNTANNLHFSGIIDMQGITPATSVKVKQETIRTNITFNGAVDGVYPIGSFPPVFDRTVALINPAMNGTLVIRRTIFFDSDGNNMLDAGECANDGIVYTITVDGEAPTFTRPADITLYKDANCEVDDTPTGPAGDVSDENDNYSTGLEATYTDIVVETCVGSYTITRTWHLVDNCNNAAADQVQTITVIDNTAPTLTVPANVTLQCTDPIPLMPLNINSSENFIDGTYNLGTAVFGPALTATPVTGDLMLVNDGNGNPADACEPIINNLSGKIAVIDRGTCLFVDKVFNAQNLGAIAVIVVNTQPGDGVLTMGAPALPPAITIPSIIVSNNYGNTLKAEMLLGTVNVSLSASPLTFTDNCSTPVITHTQIFTPGNCPNNYTLLNTWTATDACGNATTKSQTITVADNTAPTLTVPANVTLQCTDPLPLMPLEINSSPNAIAGTYNVGTAVFGAPLTATPLTADAVMVIDDAGNPYDACENITNDLTGKIAVIERSGCTPPTSYFVNKAYKAQQAGAVGVIFIFNQAGNNVATMGLPAGPNPTINIPLMLVSNTYGNTLKSEILAGTVNVSLSAQTVIANDACSFTAITHQQTITPGSCSSNYAIVNTWTATDQCGNATTASQTITVVDNTPPMLTGILPGGAVGSVCKSSAPPAPSVAMIASKYTDNCSGVIVSLLSSSLMGNNCGWTATYTYTVKDGCNNWAANAVVVYTGADITPPTFTRPANITIYTDAACGYNASVAATGDVFNEADNCSTGLNATFVDVNLAGPCVGSRIITRTWSLVDNCNNAAANQVQTITVRDNTAPTISCPGLQTKTTDPGRCYYTAVGGEFNPISTSDNCGAVTISNNFNNSNTLAGAQFPIGTTNVVWTATDACGNQATCNFDVIVTDNQNSTNYIIYAEKEVEFGEYNYIRGDVGVTDAKGKAKFKKYSVLNPFAIRSKNIDVDLPSSVTNRVYSPATGGPTPPFMVYTGSTSGLSNIDITVNGTILNNNWKDVKVKKGITCTINGDNFGKITIEEGANVTFTAGLINLEKMDIHKGKKQNNILTVVNFSNPASVKVKDKVEIGDDCRVNVGGRKVTFYMGDNSGGEEKFEVKGENSQVTANIMIPNGKLHVHGGKDITRPTIMTGWYIIEKLDSHEKYVYWNKYDCGAPFEPFALPIVTSNEEPIVEPVVTIAEKPVPFEIRAYPNPSSVSFSIVVKSPSLEPIVVKVMDMSGKVLSVISNANKGSVINLGSELRGGTYIAEVTQGKNRQTIKLVKLN